MEVGGGGEGGIDLVDWRSKSPRTPIKVGSNENPRRKISKIYPEERKTKLKMHNGVSEKGDLVSIQKNFFFIFVIFSSSFLHFYAEKTRRK